MSKICTICKEGKKTKEFYKGRQQCIPCYLAKKKSRTIDLAYVHDKLEHVAGKAHRTKARHGRKITKLKTRVDDLEDKVSDIANMFEQMQVENIRLKTQLDLAVSCVDEIRVEKSQLKTQLDLAVSRLDNMQAENTQLKDKLDLAVSCLDKTLVGTTRMETNLELAGYRMDEMQETLSNGVSVTVGIDDAIKVMQSTIDKGVSATVRIDDSIKVMQEDANKRLRRVARMFVLADYENRKGHGLNTDDYYRDFTGSFDIDLNNQSNTRIFDPENLVWRNT
ncbi:hypothetical protein K457DRAFT_26408 [Linnemannia elongata AG-77]|uniref:Uncharacterized protein n=1 Tax=Linnemannia elongata AG-77 TaxID=1314771 RepID=A0A197JCA6_9FUNG|nr:hypothetical protein K457DRAFT_26408 [Linnemannia elongata AG-77]